MTTLWALHIKGPDDIYAMPSERAAKAHADILNHHFQRTHSSVQADVVPWPYSAEAHAENMRENLKDTTP